MIKMFNRKIPPFLLTTTFIEITDEDVSTLLGYIKSLLADLLPLWLPIIAVLVGITMFSVVIWALRR